MNYPKSISSQYLVSFKLFLSVNTSASHLMSLFTLFLVILFSGLSDEMSALRFCGILTRQVINQQRSNVLKNPVFVPASLRLYEKFEASNQIQQIRTHKNFGHEPVAEAKMSRYWHVFLGIVFLGCTFNWKGLVCFIFTH